MKTSRRKSTLKGILVVLAATGLVAIGLSAFVRFLLFPQETRTLRKYSELRSSWNQTVVGHFPVEIPKAASLKKFYHFPGFLQGGASIQLRLQLPPEQIRKLYGEYSSRRTKSFFGGDTNRHMNEQEGMPTTFFVTGDTADRSFPDDYEIMIFDKVLPASERPPGFYWNHGESHGVAISTNRNEIVYWAESW